MTDKPYSNREIDAKHGEILKVLNRIEIQTTKTNGKVTQLERKNYIFMGAMSVVLIVVIPILGWALLTLTNIDGRIDNRIGQYEFSE